MIWYKIDFSSKLFGDIDDKEYCEEVENYELEELENLVENQKEHIENMNTGIYLGMSIFVGYEEDKFDEDYEIYKRILNFGFKDSLSVFGYSYMKVEDTKLLEVLNSDFINKYYYLAGKKISENQEMHYIDSNGFTRYTHANKCFIITNFFDYEKFDINEAIENLKLDLEINND